MKLWEGLNAVLKTAYTVLPITLLLVFFQVVVFKKTLGEMRSFVLGVVLTVLGLHFFLKGVSLSLLPLGENVGRNLVIMEHKWLIVGFAFLIGYCGTLVEPALRVLALEAEEISIGALPANVLLHAVAIGFGLGMALGVFKILQGIPISKIILPFLVLFIILAFVVPEQYIALGMDSASATTGPVNIPLNLAIALGLAKVIEHADPLLSGFGLIGLTSFGAMFSVFILGLLTKI
ncbi:MAG TPA: DUF1538 domain-containing protein [Clostridia bacterium]|nr:DUF1538 domain-containing protein [Clostridia bacterium]